MPASIISELYKSFGVLQSRPDPGSRFPSTYVQFFGTDTVNRVYGLNRLFSASRNKCAMKIFNKHADNISVGERENTFVGDLKNTWKTGEHLFQVLHTHSFFSISLYFALSRVPQGFICICICILHCLGFQRVALPGCPIALAFHSPTHQDLSGQRYTRKTIKPKRS